MGRKKVASGKKGSASILDNNNINNNTKKFLAKIKSRKLRICVIGLGRVGLPSAIAFAKKGFYCTGVDVNPSIVESVNSGKANLKDEPELAKLLKQVVKKGLLKATTDTSEAVNNSDVIIMCLPTPMGEDGDADYSYLREACNRFNTLQSGSLICVESTVSPGIVEDLIVPSIEKVSGKKVGTDFKIASCPERVNPSEIYKHLYSIPRIIGGIDGASTKAASTLYGFVFNVEIIRVSDCKTANAVKLTENVFRYVNIAFVTELAMIFRKMGIDIKEVVSACASKYNFVAHYPGTGAGGPCLPVNSYQILRVAAMHKTELELLDRARQINEEVPKRIINLLEETLNHAGKSLNNSTVGVLGMTYKPNVADIRVSPVEVMIHELKKRGSRIKAYDPLMNGEVFSCILEKDHVATVRDCDALIIATPHDAFKKMDLKQAVNLMNKPAVIMDPTGSLSKQAGKLNGIIYTTIGKRS